MSCSREVTTSSSLYPQGQTWHTINSQSTLLKKQKQKQKHKSLRQARKQPSLQNVHSSNCPEWPRPHQPFVLGICHSQVQQKVHGLWCQAGKLHFLLTPWPRVKFLLQGKEACWKRQASAWTTVHASRTGSQAGLCIAINWEAPATTGGLDPCDYDLIGLGSDLHMFRNLWLSREYCCHCCHYDYI